VDHQHATALESLSLLLQHAYSGELAAAYAYRGHWKSSSKPQERARIREIEEEEWRHRRQVGEMLDVLGVPPNRLREVRATIVGRVLGTACYVAGWFAPMYGAGKLESQNIREYEAAARYARTCGRDDWLDCLLTMAEVEWDHEHYFRSQVEKHWFARWFPIWPKPPARESVRATFLAESGGASTRLVVQVPGH
jgi:hypothetical protein